MPDNNTFELKKEIADFIEQAIKLDATDIHLTAGRPPIVRIDGRLSFLGNQSILSAQETKELALSLIDKDQQEKFWAYKDIDLCFSYQDKARFRVNVYQQNGNISAAPALLASKNQDD